MKLVLNIYRVVFARRAFYRFNELLFKLSLRGLGILNYENAKLSGEDTFLRRFADTLRKPLVLDVGANVGDYSNKVRSLCPDATIYAFEPHPKTFVRLQTEALKGGYAAINAGCGDKEEQLQLYDYKGSQEYSSHASLYSGVIEEFREAESVSYNVDVTIIDDFVTKTGIRRVDLLKIDVEGNELKVLSGASASIAAGLIDRIQFEFNDVNVVSRSFFRDFYKALPNYDFYRLLPDGPVSLGPYNALICELFAFQNVVAIRKDVRELFSGADNREGGQVLDTAGRGGEARRGSRDSRAERLESEPPRIRLAQFAKKLLYRNSKLYRKVRYFPPFALLYKRWLQRRLRLEVERRRAVGDPMKVVIGAGRLRPVVGAARTNYAGWLMTDVGSLDVLNEQDWRSIFPARSIDRVLAEHVFEHLTEDQLRTFLKIARKFLASSGSVRVAVPDGFHPDPAYIEFAKPGGSGPGAEDHKVIYDYLSLTRILAEEGWKCDPLEYFDERGEFRRSNRGPEDGFVLRSADHDPRNKDHPLSYTSLILDFRPK